MQGEDHDGNKNRGKKGSSTYQKAAVTRKTGEEKMKRGKN